MKWIGERISFVDQKDKITCIIYPPNLGAKLYVLMGWVVLWLAIGGYVISQLFLDYSDKERLVLIIFLAFWLYFAVRVIRTVLYQQRGREFLKLDQQALHIKKSTGKYGKSVQYFIDNISGFERVELKDDSLGGVFESSFWVRGSNRIQFEYFGKTVSFGRKLNEKDAALLHKLLLKRMEQNLRKKE